MEKYLACEIVLRWFFLGNPGQTWITGKHEKIDNNNNNHDDIYSAVIIAVQ